LGDAERLTYGDGSFDVVIAHAGLHHCHSPHRALLEMYRVARKAAIAFESRDSRLIRTAVRLGLVQ
jgi:ubiquinone/menaquinone biosynthesis C-methylase UbiE